MTSSEINLITLKLGIITSIIVYIFYSVCSYFGRKKALIRIKNSLYENEEIIYEPEHSHKGEIIFIFLVGGFLGMFILPFFIYPEIQYIDHFNRNSLPFLIICELIFILLLFYLTFRKYVITNKRIISAYTFRFMDIKNLLFEFISNKIDKNFFKSININFSDIKRLEIKTYNMLSSKYTLFIIWLNNGTYVRIPPFKDLEKVKTIIDNYIN
jgi:hypothetical protein